MADYDKNTPYQTLTTAVANYTINQDGNALEWVLDTDVSFPSNNDETTFYDYVFTLSNV